MRPIQPPLVWVDREGYPPPHHGDRAEAVCRPPRGRSRSHLPGETMPDPNLSSFIGSVADLLRGDYKQSEYGKVILPFTVLRRLDCVLEKTKPAVLAELEKRKATKVNPEPFLLKKAGQLFFNTSPLDMRKLMGDQDHIKENLYACIQDFCPNVRDIVEAFEFHTQIDRLAKAGLLLPRHREIRRHRPPSRHRQQRPDGGGVRGVDPQVRRNLQRNRR
jgi:hypothetical protein